MSCFVYIFLGSCKDITIGPTAMMGIMTNPFVIQNDNPDFAVLLCFLVGCVMVLVAAFRLGKSNQTKFRIIFSTHYVRQHTVKYSTTIN
jgi:MFS superfamily sulfate permease-like transporter